MADFIPQPSLWTGLLMAGGESRRMGQDKALLMFEGEPLWQRQWRTLCEAGVGEVLIARGAQPWEEVEGLRRVEDVRSGCGPLGGLIGGLRHTKRRFILVLAVDVPLMAPAFLRSMMELAQREGRGVAPVIRGQYEPLVAVYSAPCLPSAEAALNRGDWSLQKLMKRCVEVGVMRELAVDESARKFFRNANTPADLPTR